MGGEVAGEIILGEAFIKENDNPIIIEEEAAPIEDNPMNDIPAENNVPIIPSIILGLKAPGDQPGNFLVEEFPEDMLTDGEENFDQEANADQFMADQPENIQMGFVEVLDGFSVEPGLADYRARNIHSENAEAVRL